MLPGGAFYLNVALMSPDKIAAQVDFDTSQKSQHELVMQGTSIQNEQKSKQHQERNVQVSRF